MLNVFEFTDYQLFLAKALSAKGNRRGSKTELALKLDVRPAFITQVTQGKVHLTLEKGILTAHYLEMNAREERYFLALIGKARSGNRALTLHFDGVIQELRSAEEKIKVRVGSSTEFTVEQQLKYFGDWRNSVVQLLAVRPGLEDPAKLASLLNLDRQTLRNILQLLLEFGIIAKTDTGYSLTQKRIHLDTTSPVLTQHHTNWRLQAVQSLTKTQPSDLHYSSVWSLGEKDVLRIRALLLEIIERSEPILKDSPDEVLYSFCLDWFKVA